MVRTYVSPLRAEQAEATRSRILEAVARVLARGTAELSVPAVALEGGVSVATVKRHFPTRSDLVSGFARHIFQLQGLTPETMHRVRSLSELETWWTEVLKRRAQLDPAVRQAMAHPEVNRLREEGQELRLAAMEQRLAPLLAHLPPRDRRRVRDLSVLLLSSATANTWEMLIGSPAQDMVDTLFWALRRLFGEVGRERT